MSMTKQIYLGCYLRVWMPTEKRIDYTAGACNQCGFRSSTKFCERCGGKISFNERDYIQDMDGLFVELFDNEDQFTVIDNENGYFTVICNMNHQPGHVVIDDDSEYEIPQVDFSGDFEKLVVNLDLKKIRFETKFGIVQYYL